ncbi:MAG: hypothetical protein ABFR19_02410, partial [Pseudomonadota bacterium]
LYQNLFREQEALVSAYDPDRNCDFILCIPIADRPEHLRGCLESILQLCHLYAYGGKNRGSFSKVSVIIVEDSKERENVKRDIELAEAYTQQGLQVHHYGLQEQYELMLRVPADVRQAVSSIIGDPSAEDFYHKGQAVARNLGYLKMLQIASDRERTLFYFVDSDQQFRVNRTTPDGDEYVYGLNYFYYINRLFKTHDIDMLTGKLVCDPPVSPSVMAANFLDDVIAFFQQLSHHAPHQVCQFHPQQRAMPGEAAYHDMAHLFGFEQQAESYDYSCPLRHVHDHVACLQSFAKRINYFFFGEHLTRKSYFHYQGPFTDLSPARTIYPGNYITNFEGLKYIIPFGKLRLRMSGPTAGRLIQSEVHSRFASANLPMLHARSLSGYGALDGDFEDEYRPGVESSMDTIDLSDEFERQFFGDLMLFTVDRLAQSGVAIEECTQRNLAEAFAQVESELLELYDDKHRRVRQKCRQLSEIVNDEASWWNRVETVSASIAQVKQFIDNIQHNFGEQSKACQRIHSKSHRQQRVAEMQKALSDYRHDRNAWDRMLDSFRDSSEPARHH